MMRRIDRALEPVINRLPVAEAARGKAVIAYLANFLAWLSLRDESGLTSDDAGHAITWAIDTLVNDLQRRNETNAAGPAK